MFVNCPDGALPLKFSRHFLFLSAHHSCGLSLPLSSAFLLDLLLSTCLPFHPSLPTYLVPTCHLFPIFIYFLFL